MVGQIFNESFTLYFNICFIPTPKRTSHFYPSPCVPGTSFTLTPPSDLGPVWTETGVHPFRGVCGQGQESPLHYTGTP